MKKIFLSLMLSFALSACGTMGTDRTFDGFNWSDLNPFSESEPVQSVEIDGEDNEPNPPQVNNEAALTTEMNELAMVRGETESRIPVEDFLSGQVTRSEDGKDIVAIADITEAEPAEAAPKTDVKAVPTKDSIDWADPSKATADTSAQPTGPCPLVRILPEADSMTKFEDDTMEVKTAHAKLTDVHLTCNVGDGGTNVEITMAMDGMVTDAGRFEGNRDLEAFITFPYFIGVETPEGTTLDKKIEATAMKFQPQIDTLDHTAKATRFIPMSDPSKAGLYDVTVGFQLNRQELEYNRKQKSMAADNARVSPSRKPAR